MQLKRHICETRARITCIIFSHSTQHDKKSLDHDLGVGGWGDWNSTSCVHNFHP